MIQNARQYRITQAQAAKFGAALAELESAPPDPTLHPRLRQAELDALRSQFDDLRRELAQYDALRDDQATVIEIASLAELPRALIQARIAAGLTQRDLAERLGLREQQVQRYEATDYAAASLHRLIQVSQALDLHLHGELQPAPSS